MASLHYEIRTSYTVDARRRLIWCACRLRGPLTGFCPHPVASALRRISLKLPSHCERYLGWYQPLSRLTSSGRGSHGSRSIDCATSPNLPQGSCSPSCTYTHRFLPQGRRMTRGTRMERGSVPPILPNPSLVSALPLSHRTRKDCYPWLTARSWGNRSAATLEMDA